MTEEDHAGAPERHVVLLVGGDEVIEVLGRLNVRRVQRQIKTASCEQDAFQRHQ